MRRTSFLLALAAAALAMAGPPARAAETWNPSSAPPTGIDPDGPGGTAMLDGRASAGGAGWYAYAPSVVEVNSNERYVFFCGNDAANQTPDTIRRVRGTRVNGTWTYETPVTVFAGVWANMPTWTNYHTCDPEVVQGNYSYNGSTYSYAMFFTGAPATSPYMANPDGSVDVWETQNQIGVAFSNSLTGGWVVHPHPLVSIAQDYGQNQKCGFCVGQPSATQVTANTVLLFYMGAGGFVHRQIQLANLTTAPIPIGARTALPAIPEGGIGPSVTFDSLRDRFWMTYDVGEPTSGPAPPVKKNVGIASLPAGNVWAGTGSWTRHGKITPCHTGAPYNHNAGIARNPAGQLAGDPYRLSVMFATGYDAEGGRDGTMTYRLSEASSMVGFVGATEPVMAQNADGSVVTFSVEALPTAGSGCPSTQIKANIAPAGGGTPGDWFNVGGPSAWGSPSVVRRSDGRLQVFSRASGGLIRTAVQTAPNASSFSSLGYLEPGDPRSTFMSNPVAYRNADGRIGVVALKSDYRLYRNEQTTAGGSFSQTWTDMGPAPANPPTVGYHSDGRVVLVARAAPAAGGAVWMNRQWSASSSSWTGWSALGGGQRMEGGDRPVIGRSNNNALGVFALSADSQVWVNWTSPTGAFGSWNTLGTSPNRNPAVTTSSNNLIMLASRAQDNTVWWNRQGWLDGNFNGWVSAGGAVSSNTAMATEGGTNGSAIVAVRWIDGRIVRNREASPAAGFPANNWIALE